MPDDLNFENRTFTILVPDDYEQNNLMEGSEELVGDIANDAVIERNRTVEELLNVKLNYKPDPGIDFSTIADTIQKIVFSGDASIDLFLGHQCGITKLMPTVGFVNCNDIEHFDFSKPWWNNQYMNSLKISNKRTDLLAGDYFINIYQRMMTLFFNKNLYTDICGDTNDFYNDVINGKWTMDSMIELSENVYQDLNTNGVTDIEDRLGYVTYYPWASVDPFMYCSDIEYSYHDENGNIKLNLMDERASDLVNKIVTLFNQTGSLFDAKEDEIATAFESGRGLFRGYQSLNDAIKLRDMEYDYGFLPYPKFSEEQENYHSIIWDQALIGG